MPKSKPPYPAAFKQQIVELAMAGRTPEELSREFGVSAQSVTAWVARAAADAGKPVRGKDVLSGAEREELARLRRRVRQLEQERDILASRWPTAKHFTSWLSLSPGCKISGGKVLSSRTRKSNNPVAAHLRLAAVTVGRTETALGAFYRRLAARIGKAKAVTATARKIAILFYNTMRFGMEYQDPGAGYYEAAYRDRVVKQLHRRAAHFGFRLEALAGVS
jgi:transposase-like protein